MNISKDKIKLIATDLDGTLLNSNKEISKYNQEILKIIINDYNVQLILSSGRPYEGVKNYNKLLKNNNYSIIFNGASIVDNSGKVIYKQTVEENDAKTIIKLSEKYDVCVHVYDNGKYIVSKEDFPIKSYVQKEQTIKPIIGLENIETYKFDKILILGERAVLNELYKEILKNTDVHSSFSGELSLEITSKIGNKGNSLKWICDNKGISSDNIVAFGDNFNDIEMIEYAGIGVAMSNAEEELKQKADYITLSNEENGVGYFLKNIFEL